MLRSSRILKYIGQYFFLVPGIGFACKSIFYIADGIISDDWSENEILFTGFGSALFLTLFIHLKNKFVVVELGNQVVKIQNGEKTIERNWLEVNSIERLNFSSPSIYILRINKIKDYFIFFN